MSPSSLDVSLQPGVRALASVVSVLHARGADVAAMTYCIGSGRASLRIGLNTSTGEAHLLARQIQRRVDVIEVQTRPREQT